MKIVYSLAYWVYDVESAGIRLTGDLIIAKARELALVVKEEDPHAVFPDFSAGWLSSFKDRHNIRLSSKAIDARGLSSLDSSMETIEINRRDSIGHRGRTLDVLTAQLAAADVPVKSNEEYISKASKITLDDLVIARLGHSSVDENVGDNDFEVANDYRSRVVNKPHLTLQQKQEVIAQAIDILTEYKLSTKDLKFAQNIIGYRPKE